MPILDSLIIPMNGVAFLGTLILAVYVYVANPKGPVNRTFAVFAGVTTAWVLANILLLVTREDIFLRSTYAVGSVIPFVAIVFAYRMLQEKMPSFLQGFLATLTVVFFGLSFTRLLVVDITDITNAGFVGELGTLFYGWAVFILGQMLFFFYKLIRGYASAEDEQRIRLRYVLVGTGLASAWSLVVGVVMPLLGYLQLSNLDTPAILLLTGIIGYAVVKHQLMDARLLISQAVASSLIVISTSAVVMALIFIGAWFFAQIGTMGVAIVSVFVAAVTYVIGSLLLRGRKQLESKAAKLQASHETLEDAKKVLEVKVRARTRELREFNERLEHTIETKTKELQDRVDELEKFHRLTVGRETRMIELKNELKKLKQEVAIAKGDISSNPTEKSSEISSKEAEPLEEKETHSTHKRRAKKK